MLRIAYCQISAHPAYCGPSGSYCREPIYSPEGAILTSLSDIGEVHNICNKIQNMYIEKFFLKVQQLLHELKGKSIDVLVFPEYTIPAECLPLIYDFCQEQNCVCIAASHTVQKMHQSVYEYIHMDIPLDDSINMSCCPIITPNESTRFIFKHYKSKWEANMGVEEYDSPANPFIFTYNDQRVAILLCIDALHIDLDKKQTDIVIVAEATPSDGSFKNKFESYLTKEIPTVFCNFYLYGNSTVYCSVPKNSNLEYAEKTHITKTSANEEVVVIVDLNTDSQATTVHTINTAVPITVNKVLPVLYRDDSSEQSLWGQLKHFSQKKDYSRMEVVGRSFVESANGIIAKKKNYLCARIREQTLPFSTIENSSEYIYINDFVLRQYEINWLEKSMSSIMEGITSAKIKIANVNNAILQLGEAYQNLLPAVSEKLDLPVFDERGKANSVFQNRGGEIQLFRDRQQNGYTTFFVVQSFSQIGKSAFIDQLKYRFSFNLVNCPLPKGGGFESLVRWVCEISKAPFEWDELDEKTIEKYANYFAQYLNNLNKTMVVFRTTGNLFDSYNEPKTSFFFSLVATKLFEMHTGIKLIIESSRALPKSMVEHPNISVCTLKPLYDLYIERLIEQTANNITYSLSLPQISKNSIRQCRGNPAMARMLGVYIGNRINSGFEADVSQENIEAFAEKYTDGILEALNVTGDEKDLLIESTIYRLQVPEDAYRKLPHYTEQLFRVLQNKLLIENSNDWFFVNPLISGSLRKKVAGRSDLHEAAAQYFDSEYRQNESYVAKAEYLYHTSFWAPKLHLKDSLKYYANDILSAAIELINNGDTDIAQSHLDSIRFFQDSYNRSEFSFYYALCHILNDEYGKFRTLFDEAVKERAGKKDVLYYRMIDRLIKTRRLSEAENLLNEVCDQYPHTRQMAALWVAYYYASKQTRPKSVAMAINLTQNSTGDFYSAKILVRIYLRENMITEAAKEVNAVLDDWPSNQWARRMHYLITTGKYKADEDDDFDTDEEFDDTATLVS